MNDYILDQGVNGINLNQNQLQNHYNRVNGNCKEKGGQTARPSQAIYRPPVARIKESSDSSSDSMASNGQMYGYNTNTTADMNVLSEANRRIKIPSTMMTINEVNYFNEKATASQVSVPSTAMPIKSALKRSKSFGFNSADQCMRLLHGIDAEIPLEHQTLVRRAVENPNSLVMTQLMEVVRIMCNKAIEKSSNSYPVAKMCLTIIDRDKGKMFLESLMNCCREWFNERSKLLRSSTCNYNRRWTAYVSFLTELYLNLKSKHRHVKLLIQNSHSPNCDNPKDSSDFLTDCQANQAALISKQSKTLAILLFECCQVILSSTMSSLSSVSSGSSVIDIECLLSVLRSVGRFMEDDNAGRMVYLVSMIRDVFILSSSLKLSSTSQKSLMEIIEFRASKWQFNQSQQLYYFPYTQTDSVAGDAN